MFFRKYLTLYDSTFPWVWCIILSWWVDRLFVELGHRYVQTTICTHNDLQYVHIHQYLTIIAILIQSFRAINKRRQQFKREVILTGSRLSCLIHIYVYQLILTIAWTMILSVSLDVSPWLCSTTILEYRACFTVIACLVIIMTLFLEKIGWDWSLQRGIVNLDNI